MAWVDKEASWRRKKARGKAQCPEAQSERCPEGPGVEMKNLLECWAQEESKLDLRALGARQCLGREGMGCLGMAERADGPRWGHEIMGMPRLATDRSCEWKDQVIVRTVFQHKDRPTS